MPTIQVNEKGIRYLSCLGCHGKVVLGVEDAIGESVTVSWCLNCGRMYTNQGRMVGLVKLERKKMNERYL